MSFDNALPASFRFDAATKRVRLDPHDDAFVQDPYAAYAFLHAHAPAFFWEDYGFWCFAGYDDVNRLLRDRRFGRERRFTTGDGSGPVGGRLHLAEFDAAEMFSLLELEPPFHTRLRNLVTRAFVSRQVERLRPRIEAVAHTLINGFEAAGSVDLLPAFATPVPITIIAELLGVPSEMGPQLVSWSNRMVAMYMHGRNAATEHDANAAARDFAAFLRGYFDDRRRRPGDDLLSQLLAARDEGRSLSEDELVSSTVLLLNAGHEATVHQTGNAVRAVLEAGGDAGRFFGDEAATAGTVEECLRIDPPLHMFTRYVYAEAELAPGVTVGPGDEIGLLLGAANNDPQAFTEPRMFDPARPDQKNVSFGAGIHFCIGAPLARLEMQVALRVLFQRLPRLRLGGPPRYSDSYHFHGLERLEVEW